MFVFLLVLVFVDFVSYNIVSCKSMGAFKHALYTHFKY